MLRLCGIFSRDVSNTIQPRRFTRTVQSNQLPFPDILQIYNIYTGSSSQNAPNNYIPRFMSRSFTLSSEMRAMTHPQTSSKPFKFSADPFEVNDPEDYVQEDDITMKALLSTSAGQDFKNQNKNKIQGENLPIVIKITKHKGRGLFVKETNNNEIVVEKDDVIFQERPFAAVPNNNDDFCSNCLQTISEKSFRLPSGSFVTLGQGLKQAPEALLNHPKVIKASNLIVTCSNCESEKFCSKECEKEGSEKYHKITCQALGPSPFRSYLKDLQEKCEDSDTKVPLLVARIFSMLIQEIKDNKIKVIHKENSIELSGGSWTFLQRLGGFIENVETEESSQELLILQKLFKNHEIVNLEIYKTLKAAVYRNSSQLEIQTEFLIPPKDPSKPFETTSKYPSHGAFLPFFGAFINHSCDPNVAANTLDNSTIEWLALRDIKSGEELFASYVPTELPMEDRREMLWDNWGFWCTCHKCLKEEADNKLLE